MFSPTFAIIIRIEIIFSHEISPHPLSTTNDFCSTKKIKVNGQKGPPLYTATSIIARYATIASPKPTIGCNTTCNNKFYAYTSYRVLCKHTFNTSSGLFRMTSEL